MAGSALGSVARTGRTLSGVARAIAESDDVAGYYSGTLGAKGVAGDGGHGHVVAANLTMAGFVCCSSLSVVTTHDFERRPRGREWTDDQMSV